jgi:hypothetical protein
LCFETAPINHDLVFAVNISGDQSMTRIRIKSVEGLLSSLDLKIDGVAGVGVELNCNRIRGLGHELSIFIPQAAGPNRSDDWRTAPCLFRKIILWPSNISI